MPVELLVRNFDGTGGRKKGDVVSKRPAGFNWGKGEGPPNYTIIKIDDKEVKDLPFIRHKVLLFDDRGEAIETLRSPIGINLDALPVTDKAAISLNLPVYSDWSSIGSRLIDYIALNAKGVK